MTLEEAERAHRESIVAREAAERVLQIAQRAEHAARSVLEDAKRREAEKIPVDRNAIQLADGSPVPQDGNHRSRDPRSGQQNGYIVLTEAERAKGFVRIYRDAYRHVGVNLCNERFTLEGSTGEHFCGGPPGHEGPHGFDGGWRVFIQPQPNRGCGSITTMSRAIAETYARDPSFYSSTFCSACREHFPVGDNGEFTWFEMNGAEGPKVGT